MPGHWEIANDLCRADAVGQPAIDSRLEDLGSEEGQLDHHADVAAALAFTGSDCIDTVDTPGDQIVEP